MSIQLFDRTSSRSQTQVATSPSGSGHVGLVVLGSIGIGVVFGVVLDVLVFGGSRETVILSLALLSIASGCAALVVLSTRRTDQPQRWPVTPAFAFGLGGIAILIADPSSRVLSLLGWIWPVLLVVLVVGMFRGSRRSLHHWSRRALLYPAFVLLVLVAFGGAFETVVEAATSNSPPAGGRTYLVAGHSLYLRCAGSGSPTVILFNGLGERTSSWAWVQRSVSPTTRVCAFDRAGEGWSGVAPARQDGHQLASDLHQLLWVAHVPGPYVLAGHSVGGVYALVYAKQYPRDVAGVALIDSATPYQFDLPDYPSFYAMGRRLYSVMPSLARVGLARLTAASQFANLPHDARRQARAFASSPRELRADHADFAELPTVFEQAKALKSLDGKPLAVLTASVGEQSGWLTAQKKLVRLSRNSVQRTIVGATHAALLEDKGFAWFTSRAITQVVQFARSGQR